MSRRRPVVSVIGDARLEDLARIEEARRLGACLLEAGFRIVTGGMGGVMEAVSYGARHSAHWTEGSIIGILPSYRSSEANEWCDIVIPSGMQLARNVLVVSSADVVVATGGGAGTLSEIALAHQLSKPIIALGGHGWAGRVAGEVLDGRGLDAVCRCASVEDAVAACIAALSRSREGTDIGGGGRAPKKERIE
jgi:uncharacterized protein (TIGR00725 family)